MRDLILAGSHVHIENQEKILRQRVDQSQVFISALLHHVQKIVPLVKVTLIFFHQTGIFVLFGQKRTAKYSQTLPLLLGKSAVGFTFT